MANLNQWAWVGGTYGQQQNVCEEIYPQWGEIIWTSVGEFAPLQIGPSYNNGETLSSNWTILKLWKRTKRTNRGLKAQEGKIVIETGLLYSAALRIKQIRGRRIQSGQGMKGTKKTKGRNKAKRTKRTKRTKKHERDEKEKRTKETNSTNRTKRTKRTWTGTWTYTACNRSCILAVFH